MNAETVFLLYLPSNVSRCGSPPPFAVKRSQNSPSHPPEQLHSASHFGAMIGCPLPEQSVKRIIMTLTEERSLQYIFREY